MAIPITIRKNIPNSHAKNISWIVNMNSYHGRGTSYFKKSVKNIVESQRFSEKSMESQKNRMESQGVGKNAWSRRESQKNAWSRRESEKMHGVTGSRKKIQGVAGSRGVRSPSITITIWIATSIAVKTAMPLGIPIVAPIKT